MKKTLALTLVACMSAALLAGCGGSSDSTTSSSGSSSSSASTTTPSTSEETYNMSIGMNSVEGDVPYYLAEFFKTAIEEKSEGRVTVDMYPGGQMGGDAEMVENVMAGGLEFYSGTISTAVPYVTAAAVLNSCWAFDDLEHFRNFVDSGFIDTMNVEFEGSGMQISAVAEVGMRNLMSNKKIETMDDISGLKVRVMTNQYDIAAWEGIGAAPTPMDWGEVYVGLQQKMIDAVEQPYFFICSSKLYEVQDYLLLTQHQAQPAAIIMSTEKYESYPADIQALIQECSDLAVEQTRAVVDSMQADRLQEIKDNGVEVSELSAEMLAEMRERVQPSNDLIETDVGTEFYAAFVEAVDASR